jgi:FAD synthetase
MTEGPSPVRVMAAGVFDLLHPGHVHYLDEAREQGDELVVVVARDASVRERKHPPILPESTRRELVAALKPVDRAILGDEEDELVSVERLEPDVIALGYDDHHDEEAVREACRARGVDVDVERMSAYTGDLAGTREILRRIADSQRYRDYVTELSEANP